MKIRHPTWRNLKQNVLPVLVVGAAVLVGTALIFQTAQSSYRKQVYDEVANLVGVLADYTPEHVDLLHELKELNPEQIAIGEEILKAYGYDDAVPMASATYLAQRSWQVAGIAILVFAITLSIYFVWREMRRAHELQTLNQYLQNLHDQIYDLRLEENSEDELSQLSNDLYKVVVSLRESVEQNRKIRHSLEIALADVSHQLKTPLTSLQIAVDNLSANTDMPPDTRQEFLRIMSRQVEAMSELVSTLLNLAKFDNGTIRMQPRTLKISQILGKVIDRLAALADLQDVTIMVEGDLGAEVKLDLRWQVEALTNIVKNCLEHSPPGSTVGILVERRSVFTRLTIHDQGEGISKRDLRHIFERFYRAQNSAPDSVGIGLAFAKAIINAEHGQISVKSTPGKGTTFIITYFS